MRDPREMSGREQADYLRLEIISRFIKPMLDAGIDSLFICATMAEAAGSLCPAKKDLNMLYVMISKGFEALQMARCDEKGIAH